MCVCNGTFDYKISAICPMCSIPFLLNRHYFPSYITSLLYLMERLFAVMYKPSLCTCISYKLICLQSEELKRHLNIATVCVTNHFARACKERGDRVCRIPAFYSGVQVLDSRPTGTDS
jgi:hypothetical protein